jgi:hypothetical protein
MSYEFVSEIRTARRCLARLSMHERRRLLSRILDEIQRMSEDDTADSAFDYNVGLQRLMASALISMDEIAEMNDEGFGRVLDELAQLLVTMTLATEMQPPISQTIH